MSVLLPSSTLPQVRKRSSSFFWWRGEVGVDVFADSGRRLASQKYPSRFFCSIDPASSWSITRPCRSEFLRQQHLLDDLRQRRRVALDRPGQRVAAERAEPHPLHHRLLAGPQPHPLVVHHDAACRRARRPGGRRRSTAARSGCSPGGCTARRRARSSCSAGRRGCSRPCSPCRCTGSTAPAAGSSGPTGAAGRGSSRRAPWPGSSPRRGGRRRTPRRTGSGSAPASAPAVFMTSVYFFEPWSNGLMSWATPLRVDPDLQVEALFAAVPVAELDHRPELPGRVDVQQRERQPAGVERLLRQAQHDRRSPCRSSRASPAARTRRRPRG